MHKGRIETWIAGRAIINRGWIPAPRRALPGRHAYTVGRDETRGDARLFGAIRALAVMVGRRARNGSHGVRYARAGA